MTVTPTIKHEGFLTKEGGGFKSWKKRWFILRGGPEASFSYYKTKGESTPLGIIHINTVGHIKVSDRKKKNHQFEVQTPSRIFYICADNDEDRNKWIEVLITERDTLLGSNKPKKPERVGVHDFDLLNLVGKGSFGKVIQVRKKDTGEIFAMKVLSKKHIVEHNEVEHTLSERNILQKINHPFLVNLNYSFQTEDKLYFILDYINGGELFYHLQKEKKFSEDRVRYYGAEIVLALEHLHLSGVIYRDLKPENLLLTNEGHICMTDFGLCKEGLNAPSDKTITFCGTPEYLAPEVLQGNGYGKQVDWWSFGSLLFEMLTGLPPFYSQDVQEMYRKIMSERLVFPGFISPEARSLLEMLLERDPDKRLSDPNIIKRHPFFRAIDWEMLFQKKIPPPFIPNVKGSADTSQIDPVFTDEAPSLTMAGESALNPNQQKDFEVVYLI
ncbi:protein serine/threonine kinase [Cavenderia fasciculata]|uniref:non-specific serine/threonine protein kinase n=1 Tax=Cavenderia fasciculata TaxID=261658 RepID=F4Q412_CACFS|nr:protein serine/threonine kinase [Cavenderia fasciculata]EGG16926.1 protein serine/threonine kinase [Cavenderia fasciculata]|eukprot:XP_004355400.1 protein serine/threonine kinase [Cavenderia fasciculata]